MVAGLDAAIALQRGTFRLEVELGAAPGEVVGLLGPNGAGKSSTLRALAGLLKITSGQIVLADRTLARAPGGVHVPAHRRPIGVVFQDYLLFPHLSVLDNVAFGPRSRGASRRDSRTQAAAWLARVGAAGLDSAHPRSLSGGQAQRVALARALATEPELLILDEPLAALDARTRVMVRGDLRRHLSSFTGASVVVTHDPVDAIVLADRLVVIEEGRVVQVGSPAEVTRRPRTDYVARLVGLNLATGVAHGHEVRLPAGGSVYAADVVEGPCSVAFRPASVSVFTTQPVGSPRNNWLGRVVGLEPHGDGVRVEIADVPDRGGSVIAEITQAALADLGLQRGREVWASVKASDIEVYPNSVG